ncbi:MAG: calcium-binding protein [Velocimicrobium sp.]
MDDNLYSKVLPRDKLDYSAGLDEKEGLETYENWENYFGKTLKFPFEAKISECQEGNLLQEGDSATVLGVSGKDDLYGILVRIAKKRKQYIFPLCDIEVVDEKSENYLSIDDYCHWFANYR